MANAMETVRLADPRHTADGGINVTLDHPVHGPIPYTARDGSGEADMQVIWDRLQAMEVAPYAPPSAADTLAAWRARARVTRRAFCMALFAAGILTKPQAIEAAKGDWPAAMAGALDGMTEAEAADAEIAWASVTEVQRDDPLIGLMQQFLSLTDAQVDALFGDPPG